MVGARRAIASGLALILAGVVICVSCSGARRPVRAGEVRPAAGVLLRTQILDRPRPLHLWAVRIDLTDPDLEVFAVTGSDPDGPAEAVLTDPLLLAAEAGALLLINANPWARIMDGDGDWRAGEPVQIAGLVAQAGDIRSPTEGREPCLWIDQAGRAHATLGLPADAQPRTGIAGFTLSLRDGRVVGPAGADLHPRSAVGIADGGRTLWLLVADGRDPGVSEGLSMAETAEQLRLLGCSDGIVLDGGGSSVLVLDMGAGPQVVNNPSDGQPRPLPVALGVRRR